MTRVYTCQKLGELGRLGNQLFQVAGTITRAMQGHGAPALHPQWPYRKYFQIPDMVYGFFDDLTGYEIIDCEGYMQDKEYAMQDARIRIAGQDSRAVTLWQWLQPSEFARLEANEHWKLYGEELKRTIAVHVRRGDYLLYPDVFARLGSDYYGAAIEMLMSTGHFSRILLFSDDMSMAMQELEGLGWEISPAREIVDPFNDVLTMQLMSRCGGFVIANSTFSWWAARLSESEHVVMPSRWGMNSSPMGIEFQKRAFDLKVSWWKQSWGEV